MSLLPEVLKVLVLDITQIFFSMEEIETNTQKRHFLTEKLDYKNFESKILTIINYDFIKWKFSTLKYSKESCVLISQI